MPSHMRDVDPIFGAVPLDIPNVSWRSSNARAATDDTDKCCRKCQVALQTSSGTRNIFPL